MHHSREDGAALIPNPNYTLAVVLDDWASAVSWVSQHVPNITVAMETAAPLLQPWTQNSPVPALKGLSKSPFYTTSGKSAIPQRPTYLPCW